MPKYKVFSNDRGKQRGVPMYSCLMEVAAANERAAVAQANPAFGPPHFAVMVAIEWPPYLQESKDWLAKHT